MALATWPDGLPSRPVMDSGGVDSPYPEGVVSEFEDGPPRARPQSFTGIRKVPYMIRFRTRAAFAAFDAFVSTTLQQGSAQFTMPIYLAGVGCVTRRVYIEGGRWSAKPIGNGGQMVSFTLCVIPA